MRIRRITFKNYRQFRDVELIFKKAAEHDIHMVKGVMGVGKTNILNGINWCLYEEEPFMANEERRQPILNVKVINEKLESNVDRLARVSVEVDVESEGGEEEIVFKRGYEYEIVSEREIKKKKGNLECYRRNEYETEYREYGDIVEFDIESFVPKKIKEFFFFDGERLDRYFEKSTSKNIKQAVLAISKMDIVERILSTLKTLLKNKREESAKLSPKLREKKSELEKKEEELENVKRRIENLKKDIEDAVTEIGKYETRLREAPDVGRLEEEREELIEKKKEKEEELRITEGELGGLLIEKGAIVLLWKAIKRTDVLLKEKIEKKEIPPVLNVDILTISLREGKCIVCGKLLSEEDKKHLKDLLNEVSSQSRAPEVWKFQAGINSLKEEIKKFGGEYEKLSKNIEKIGADLEKIESKIRILDKKLLGFRDKDKDEIREWHERRKKYEEIKDNANRELGRLEHQKEVLVKEVEKLEKEYKKELEKEEKHKELLDQIEFLEESLAVLEKLREKVLEKIRKEIKNKTEKMLKELMWKKESFGGVEIDSDFNVSFRDSSGFECIGSISEGERVVFGLAFTTALHEVSGFDAPIVIDRPLSKPSGVTRERIMEALLNLSKKRQVIIFMAPDDLQRDVSWIEEKCATVYELNFSSDKMEATAVRKGGVI